MLPATKKLLEEHRQQVKDWLYDIDAIKRSFQQLAVEFSFECCVYITGSIENRIAVLYHPKRSFIVILHDEPKSFLDSDLAAGLTSIEWISPGILAAEISKDLINNILSPSIKLIGLFHPENFPLPRFHLALSDIAGAVRYNMLGSVALSDMQLNDSLTSIKTEINEKRFDVLGISVTFGQQDLLEELLDSIQIIEDYIPLTVVGGSLAALNSDLILKKYPSVIVAKGYGESTMQDIVKYWKNELSLEEINDICYVSSTGEIKSNPKKKNDLDFRPIPELDLLSKTLELKGVMQLEASRGCTYFCSFCPREHKGKWYGGDFSSYKNVLNYISKIFESYPNIPKKIFLVDEEFVGYKGDSVITRAKNVADVLKANEFKFETSTRIDQVYRPKENREWHIARIAFWRYLIANGLDRVLFGVESGVNSILKRFNKVTTSVQNVYAIRTLSLIGVPVRYTYITFDPLMSMDELVESYTFQGRKDLLLASKCGLTDDELFDTVFDEQYAQEHNQSLPLYREIPYMLVSMECLLNSPYLALVEKQGLAGAINLQMGKRESGYLDPVIGLFSQFSQFWIDRNFALDYCLKSILKVTESEERRRVDDLRFIIKDFAYNLLGSMLYIATEKVRLRSPIDNYIIDLSKKWKNKSDTYENILENLLNYYLENLTEHFISFYDDIRSTISDQSIILIEKELAAWQQKIDWKLINDYRINENC